MTLNSRIVLWMLVLPNLAQAQSWTNIPFEATTYVDFNGATTLQEFGWTWYLGFPVSDTGVQDLNCIVQPAYNYYLQSAPDQSNPTQQVWWQQPPYTNWWRNVGSVYRSKVQNSVRGLQFQGSFGGIVASSSGTPWDFIDQAVYYHVVGHQKT